MTRKIIKHLRTDLFNLVTFKHAVICFLLIVVFGLLLNIASLIFPKNDIHKNVLRSANSFITEGSFPDIIKGYGTSIPDNNTDAWMLIIADYHDDNIGIMEAALAGHYNFYSDTSTGLVGMDSIAKIVDGDVKWVGSYERYWHGWLFFLRLMLTFFNYSGIRIINMILVIALIFMVINGFYKIGHDQLAVPLIMSIIMMVPIAIPLCMAYMISFCISLISMLIIIYKREKIDEKIGIPVFFMIVGMITAYSEFLQFPIITLGFPLVLYISMCHSEKKEILEQVTSVFSISFMWAIGYCGMWIAKWIVAGIFMDPGVFTTAFSQIQIRFSATSDMSMETSVSRTYTLILNAGRMLVTPATIFLVSLILFYLYKWISLWNKGYRILKAMGVWIPFWVICMLPVAWIILLSNHSYIHSHFTFRGLAVAVFAFFAGFSIIVNNKGAKENTPRNHH